MSENNVPLLLKFNHWVMGIPLWLYSMGLVVAVGMKSGITFTPLGLDELLDFPAPPNNWSAMSYGMRTVVFLSGNEGDIAFGVMGSFIVLLSFGFLTYAASRVMDRLISRLFLALVIVGPIGMVLLNHIGRNDVFVILGATVVAMYGQKIYMMVFGLVIMILGNPEQALVAFFCLVILSFIPVLNHWRRVAVSGFVIALAIFIPLSLYVRSSGVKGRLEILPEFLSASFYPFAANLPLTLYASFGATWLIIGWVFLHIYLKSRVLLVIGILVIPLFVTMITVDQTRVTVGVTTLSVMVILREFLPRMVSQLKSLNFAPILGTGVAIVLFLPIIEIWGTSGHTRTPYLWIFTSIVPQIKSLLIS